MRTMTNFPRTVAETPDMGIGMPDGVRLSARVWMPQDALANPVPAVLEYIPYRKRDGTVPRDERMHPYMAGHGYACLRVDMRGNGDSAGLMTDEYSQQEMDDAVAVIAWIAAQPWCTGAVGMMGKSWGGFNCLQSAFLQPPALKAVVSVCATVDRFADDIHFKGGCLLGENFGWGAVMLSYSSRPPDPDLRPDWREDWLARLEAQPWLAPRWAGHQARDAYWQHGSVCEDYARMTVPVQIWGGWADNYMNAVAHLVENAAGPVQGIVGPWVHQYPHSATPGPQVGFLQLALRWWDRWLKGIPNGAEADPRYRAYMIHSEAPDANAKLRKGHWVAEEALSGARLRRQVLHLGVHAEPGRGTAHGTHMGSLAAEADGAGGGFKLQVATPQDLGLAAGEFFPMGLNAEMPGDQAGDDARSVCFDGPVLQSPLDLLGAARLRLQLASDQPLGFVVARLCDVGPDGASVRIAHGMLNLCHRNSMAEPVPMVPGQEVTVDFTLDQMAYRLAPGHRLRLALSNSYWPFIWPSPRAGRLTLTSGTLDLPLHAGGDDPWLPPDPEAAASWAHRVLREGRARRVVETDLVTGRVALVVEDDGGDVENLAHGLISGETMAERWEVHPSDPLSARATQSREQRLRRGDWSVRTVATAEMTASLTHLHFHARLTAWDGAEQIFDRVFDESVSRKFV